MSTHFKMNKENAALLDAAYKTKYAAICAAKEKYDAAVEKANAKYAKIYNKLYDKVYSYKVYPFNSGYPVDIAL